MALILVLSVTTFSLCTLFLQPKPAQAVSTIPQKINFQGRLTDASGNILPDGTYNVKFKIYDAASGGTLKWSEDWVGGNRIQVTNGLFTVQLGSITSMSSIQFSTFTPYLEIELPTPATATSASPVWTEGPMTPRQPFGSAAYAFNAEQLDGLDSSQFARTDANNTLTGTNAINNTSTTAFQIQNASAAGNLFIADTTNTRVGIGTAPTLTTDILQVTGSIYTNTSLKVGANTSLSTTSLVIGGATVCNSTGCTASASSGSYIQNTTTLQTGGANFAISNAGATTDITALIKQSASQTGDLIQLQNSSASPVASFSPSGQLKIGSAAAYTSVLNIGTNTTTAAGGITFGTDTSLYRLAASQLATNSEFKVIRTATTDIAFSALVSGDTTPRYVTQADGKLLWGDGTAARDTNLYRSAANLLATDDSFQLTGTGSNLTVQGTGNSSIAGNLAVSNGLTVSRNATSTDQDRVLSVSGTHSTTGAFNGAYGMLVSTTIAPAGGSVSYYYGQFLQAYASPSSSATITLLNASNARNALSGVSPTGTITNSYQLQADVFANQATGTPNVTIANQVGLKVNNQGSGSGTNGLTIQNAIGIDIAAQNTASTSNIGLRVGLASTYSLQLSDTGGTTAGGITFGTDTNLYRSAASTLKTDTALVVGTTLNALGDTTIGATSQTARLTVDTGTGSVNSNGVYIRNSPAVGYDALRVSTNWSDGNGGNILNVTNATGTKLVLNNAGNLTLSNNLIVNGSATTIQGANAGTFLQTVYNTSTNAAASGLSIRVDQNTATNIALNVQSGASTNLFQVLGTGVAKLGTSTTGNLQLMNDATTATSGLLFGSTQDTSLYRSAANTLKTGGALVATGAISTSNNLTVTGVGEFDNGNSSGSFASNQLLFGYGGTSSYKQAIKTRHNSGTSSGNAFDFYLWQPGDAVGGVGSLRAASINGGQLELPVQGSTGGLLLGGDVNLYRSAVDTLQTDDALVVAGATTLQSTLTVGGSLYVGTRDGTNTYSSLDGLRISGDDVSNTIWNAAKSIVISADSGQSVALCATSNCNNGIVLQAASGNVGIGTVSPNVRLEVAGVGRFTDTYGFSIGGDAGRNRIETNASGPNFRFLNTSNAYTSIGASAASIGNTYAGTAAPASGLIVEGNVGIGTASPTAKLQVTGNTYLAGDVGSTGLSGLQSQANNLNVAQNSSFEVKASSGTEADGWTVTAGVGNGTATVARASDQQSDGTYSMKLAITGTTSYASVTGTTFIPVKPSTSYTHSIDAKNDATANSCGSGMYVRVLWYDTARTFISSSDTYSNVATTTTWTTYTNTITSPANAAFGVLQYYNYQVGGATGCTRWYDNVAFRQTAFSGGATFDMLTGGTSTNTPLLQNAGNLTLAATGANSLLLQTNGVTRLTVDSAGGASFTGTLAVTGTITGTTLNGTTGINTGASAGTQRIDSSGNLVNIGSITSTGTTSLTGNTTVNTGTSNSLAITSGTSVPTTDQLTINNAASTGVITAGVNGFSINYKGGAAAVESAAQRIDIQPGTASGGVWSGLRLVANATGAVSGVTENALKVDNLTTPGAGTENALFVGTGWDSILSYNGTQLLSGTGVLQSAALSGTYSNALTLSSASNSLSGSGANLTALNATNISSGTVASARIAGSYTGITGVGALTAGSITSFGTINTGSTITGTTLNGTTGINTGAGAGTQRIDANGNASFLDIYSAGAINVVSTITAGSGLYAVGTVILDSAGNSTLQRYSPPGGGYSSGQHLTTSGSTAVTYPGGDNGSWAGMAITTLNLSYTPTTYALTIGNGGCFVYGFVLSAAVAPTSGGFNFYVANITGSYQGACTMYINWTATKS